MMFRALLYQHWKSIRLPLFVLVVGAFALPLVTALASTWDNLFGSSANAALYIGASLGNVYPLLAAAAGLLVAMSAWSADHRGGHVYAMTLPIHRSRYATLRFGVGITLLMAPIAALTLGSVSATLVAPIPEGLTAYPAALGVRFGLAALVAYAMIFAISAGTPKAAGYVILALVALPLIQVLLGVVGSDINILKPIAVFLFDTPGPFDIFGGRWMLIDV